MNHTRIRLDQRIQRARRRAGDGVRNDARTDAADAEHEETRQNKEKFVVHV
jgi:hypothetical protein